MRDTVPLRIEVLHVVVDVRQQLRATLHRVLMGDAELRESSPELRIVSFGAGKGILQRKDKGLPRSPGIRIWGRCGRQYLSGDSGRSRDLRLVLPLPKPWNGQQDSQQHDPRLPRKSPTRCEH